MGIEGIMVRSFAQFGVAQTDYDMARLLTENALFRQAGDVQEAALISPDILTPEGRKSYTQITLLVRQAARRLRREEAQALRQEAAEQARTGSREEWLREQQEAARKPREAPAAMTRDDPTPGAAAQPDSATARATGGGPDTLTTDAGRAADAESASPLPAGRTGNGRQPRPGERATARTTGQPTDRVAELSDAAVDGLPDQAMRTEVPSLLHLTV